MSMISEQVKELREYTNVSLYARECETKELLKQAADTIESLSAKLQAANRERSADGKKTWRYCKECEHYTPLPSGVRGGKRGYCEKRYPRDSRRGCIRACTMFSEKGNKNEP